MPKKLAVSLKREPELRNTLDLVSWSMDGFMLHIGGGSTSVALCLMDGLMLHIGGGSISVALCPGQWAHVGHRWPGRSWA